jgi:putative sterol carrier protein
MGFVVGKQAQAPEGVFVRFDVVGDVSRRIDIEVRQGRAVPVEDLETEPTAVLRMDQESFWRLACGRVPGEAALFAGLVELEGDISIARQVLSSMAFMI